MGVGGQGHAPAALPPGKIPYPLYRKLGGPQSRSGRVRNISPPPGIDPRTVQPVASRYTDWAIAAPDKAHTSIKYAFVKDTWRHTYTLFCRILFQYICFNKFSGEEWVLQEYVCDVMSLKLKKNLSSL